LGLSVFGIASRPDLIFIYCHFANYSNLDLPFELVRAYMKIFFDFGVLEYKKLGMMSLIKSNTIIIVDKKDDAH
jgi:hypothetical protein